MAVIMRIDASEVVNTMNKLAAIMTREKAQELFRRTFNDAGRRVKHIAKEDFPHQYNMKSGKIGDAVGWPGVEGENVVVPIKSVRGTIGGTFPALGGAYKVQSTTVHRKDGTTKKRKAHLRERVIQAKVLKGALSTLPDNMPSWQGGQPPFRNPHKSNGLVFTRWGKERYPIHRVVGIGVPQPPINRSEDEFRKDLNDYMMKQLEHHFQQIMK